MISISPQDARRMAISCQNLDAAPQAPDKEYMLSVIRQLGCLQLDPINVVARSPLLVLWSRLGNYKLADLETLLWQDKRLFEYWAHAASIVLTEDYPLHQAAMKRFAKGNTRWEQKVSEWMEVNQPFQKRILAQLAKHGPLYLDEIETPPGVVPWPSGGWSDNRNSTVMMGFLWEQGKIMVSNRAGNGFGLKKQWALTEQHLPDWHGHAPWSEAEVVKDAAQKSLRALGAGTAAHIKNHFIRRRYPGLSTTLRQLVREKQISPVQVVENGRVWDDTWYIHQDNLPLLEKIKAGSWQSRTTLLSPFDNLICDRDRTELLFGFRYRSEIYTPKAKRQYGYYVLPVLKDDQLVGRIDPKMDRKRKRLQVFKTHFEPGVRAADTMADIRTAVEQLAVFLGANSIVYEN